MYSLMHFGMLSLLLASCEMADAQSESNENENNDDNNSIDRDPETDNAFRNASIVPKFLIESPVRKLDVIYPSARVELGNDIFLTKTVVHPKLNYTAGSEHLFTFLMADLDFPSPAAPLLSSYIISLIVNIRGTNISSGELVVPYIPITPEPKSGSHRIVALLLKQSESINTDDLKLLELATDRWRFSIENFKKVNRIAELFAGNFFTSEIPQNYADFC